MPPFANTEGIPSSSEANRGGVKLKAPTFENHGGGAKVDPLSSPIPTARLEEMIQTLSSNTMSFETKQHVMKRAVLQCPSFPIEVLGQKVLA